MRRNGRKKFYSLNKRQRQRRGRRRESRKSINHWRK